MQPNEQEAARRGTILADMLFARLNNPSSTDVSTSLDSSSLSSTATLAPFQVGTDCVPLRLLDTGWAAHWHFAGPAGSVEFPYAWSK